MLHTFKHIYTGNQYTVKADNAICAAAKICMFADYITLNSLQIVKTTII